MAERAAAHAPDVRRVYGEWPGASSRRSIVFGSFASSPYHRETAWSG